MNETIGEIGGHNDQKRRIHIKREQRKKLDEYDTNNIYLITLLKKFEEIQKCAEMKGN